MASPRDKYIQLRGVRVHNLRNVDLDLPIGRLIALTGVSGSGKSSLAFDTLFAEGQRRYIETFSAYARQFLNPLPKPDADRIDHLPPAIAVRQHNLNLSTKSTVATATELHDYLRLLFARIGRIVCPGCGADVRRDQPEDVLAALAGMAEGTRFQVCFPIGGTGEQNDKPLAEHVRDLAREGFTRVIVGGRSVAGRDRAGQAGIEFFAVGSAGSAGRNEAWVVVDRLTAGKAAPERVLDSVELALREGDQRCIVLVEASGVDADGETAEVDGRTCRVLRFSSALVCDRCRVEFQSPEPRLFSFNTPLGACPECEGFGTISAISFEHLVPDPTKSLRDGAIAPWTTPAYRHELEELLALAGDFGIPVDVPFDQLLPHHLQLIRDGVPERNFGGLRGFFRWLERRRYRLSVRVFLNRWRTYEACPRCSGDRLRPDALAVRIGAFNIAELCRLSVSQAAAVLADALNRCDPPARMAAAEIMPEIQSRLACLQEVGLGYLTLDRTVRTLSAGEAQRIALTAALGSRLVNTLYVLDEPSAGLHPRDSARVVAAIRRLQQAGNTVVVVEHEWSFIEAADQVVDLGPGAGREGGRVLFQGAPAELPQCGESLTGRFLAREAALPERWHQCRKPTQWIHLEGARAHNLKNLTVEIPLGVLCVVAGVSGSGKSTLVADTLYPALARALKRPGPLPPTGAFDRLAGTEHIEAVELVDQQPLGRTRRSNPVTYLGAFDQIRALFADTPQAKQRNYTAGHFSFNARGGRCPRCLGHGVIDIDMHFMAEVSMTCPECNGKRFRQDILEVKYRGRSIAEVLDLTAAEAFTFFRGCKRLQRRLQALKEIGLDYLPLGQPAHTLSGGESQRLKLAAHLAAGTRSRTLFLLDEPTRGLHPADVARLLACFANLLAVGHSLVVIEHDRAVIRAADWVIELGPEAGDAGGYIIACGAPQQ